MRLTRLERKAALAVAGMTVAVVVSGVKLLKKHTRYMTQKAAAFFRDEEKPEQEETLKEEKPEPEETLKEEKPEPEGTLKEEKPEPEETLREEKRESEEALKEDEDDAETAEETQTTGTAGDPGRAE